MKNFYITVDDAFLKTTNFKSQQLLKKQIDDYGMRYGVEKTKYRCYVRLCPYCNKFGILICRIFEVDDNSSTEPNSCVFCGESTPYYKITHSIKKAQILYDLSAYYASNDTNQKNIQNERVLLEQCVVVLATGIELFLKDIYILSMDLKYVKPEFTLHLKFNQDAKNDFLNIGKAIKKFKTEFKIDITEILGRETIKNLSYLMLMRNLIVHNNSDVDLIFLNNIPNDLKKKYHIGTPVPITNNEVSEFIKTTKMVLKRIETEFDKLIVPEIRKRIETNFQSFDDRHEPKNKASNEATDQ